MTEQKHSICVKAVGLGATGLRLVDKLAALEFPATQFLVLDTDCQELQRCQLAERIQLGEADRRGWGCSGDVGEGAKCVRAARDLLAGKLSGADLVVIVTGLGGGMGGGGAPVVAELAAECGALTVVLAIEPFELEGRTESARLSLQRLSQVADTVVRLSNQGVLERQGKGCLVPECLEVSNNLVLESLMGLGRLMRSDGLLNIDFAHVRKIVGGQHGESLMATVEVAGDARPRVLVDAILKHHFLVAENYLREAEGLLISLAGSESLSMAEVHEFVEYLKAAVPEAQLALGVHIDESLGNYLSAMVMMPCASAAVPEGEPEQPVNRLPAEPEGDLPLGLADIPNLAQQQLPLVAVSKGRFDKGEPTVHDGEDLDVPTFLRRNLLLN
jgi:cell division protein FtsZ